MVLIFGHISLSTKCQDKKSLQIYIDGQIQILQVYLNRIVISYMNGEGVTVMTPPAHVLM